MANVKVDTSKIEAKKEAASEKMPLFKYEPDSKYTSKLWIFAAAAFAVCAVLYVIGIMLPNAMFTGMALVLAVVCAVAVGLMYRKMRRANVQLSDKEIDKLVESYKADLIDTFNGYDLDYDAHDILTAADKYRRTLEAENKTSELGEDESLVSIFKKSMGDSAAARQKRRDEKKADKARRKEDKAYEKALKKEKKNEK